MRAFLWTMLVFQVLTVIGCLNWLAKGEFPQRTAAGVASDVFFNAALSAWVIYLLAGGA